MTNLLLQPSEYDALEQKDYEIVEQNQIHETFEIGEFSSGYIHQYKYLGFWINEFLDNSESARKV